MNSLEQDFSFYLNREEIRTDRKVGENVLSGQVILITGSGGSIGDALVKEILKYGFKKLVLLDRSEASHIKTAQKINDIQCSKITQELCDITNAKRLESIFENYRPDIVFHTAAYKHVPILEQYPIEAAVNNVLATKSIADLCNTYDVRKSVFISSDKAVYPETLLGASKRLGEFYYHTLDAENADTDKSFLVVRFGNVIASSGSVFKVFEDQIANKQPVTVTDKDAERYFMSSREAVNLILSCVNESNISDSRTCTYILNLGEPVKINDIALKLIESAGSDIKQTPISYIGLRAGEKLKEYLYESREEITKCHDQNIVTARYTPYTAEQVREIFENIRVMAGNCDADGLRAYMTEKTDTQKFPHKKQKLAV